MTATDRLSGCSRITLQIMDVCNGMKLTLKLETGLDLVVATIMSSRANHSHMHNSYIKLTK